MPATTRSLDLDQLVDRTPDTRDRSVDCLRACSIAVVVLWHWVLSVTHWNSHGALTMPNPVDDVPLLWLATWALQVMPLFFFVGGFANFVASRHGAGRAFVASRLRRLFRPIGVFAAVWCIVEVLAHALMPGYRGVLHWGFVVFVPLWFLGVYAAVVALVPVTVRWHERRPGAALAGLAAAVAIVDVIRFRYGVEMVGYANTLFVFLFVHQLGYAFGDGTLVRWSRRAHVAMVAAAASVLAVLTTCGPYGHSMVAVPSDHISNMMPPNACIAVLGVLQAGLALLARPALNRRLARRGPWKLVVRVNAIAMTVFTWHMTAYVLAVGAAHVFGIGLLARPTASWWMQRPLWLALPGVFLAGFVAIFARYEHANVVSVADGHGRRARRGASA
jgi:surface polysaccharide O-acyltransferase-like enzyme